MEAATTTPVREKRAYLEVPASLVRLQEPHSWIRLSPMKGWAVNEELGKEIKTHLEKYPPGQSLDVWGYAIEVARRYPEIRRNIIEDIIRKEAKAKSIPCS